MAGLADLGGQTSAGHKTYIQSRPNSQTFSDIAENTQEAIRVVHNSVFCIEQPAPQNRSVRNFLITSPLG